MSDTEITLWMKQLAADSPEAAEKIWEHYFEKLVQYARRKLGNSARRVADEEDVALSAFHSLHRGLEAGRFPKFDNRDDLWKILLTITSSKATKVIRKEMALKRGGGATRGESVFLSPKAENAVGINNVVGAEPTPEFAELVSVECDELLEDLQDAVLREIAVLKLQGYKNEEIAGELDCSVRSVERKLNRIRAAWEKQLKPE